MNWFSIEVILSVATVVISIVVLISERMQTEGQVRPHLNIFSGNHRNQVYIRIANCGMGPGVIDSLKVEKFVGPQRQKQTLITACERDCSWMATTMCTSKGPILDHREQGLKA